ncbi:MAG TPA: exodeoxyribonuclease VII large subunit [Acidimicrobiales bacterium]
MVTFGRGRGPDDGQLRLAVEGAGEPTLRVSELSAQIADVVARGLPDEVWVVGEVANLRARNRTGHTYFELVEQEAGRRAPTAKLDVALLQREREWLEGQLAADGGLTLENGLEVRIRARVDFWSGGGRLQLAMTGFDPVHTVGVIAARRQAVLRTMEAEGLLRANRGVRVSPVPLVVGLVTSENSAAYIDVISVLAQSGYGFHVISIDTRVQGPDAPPSIARSLRRADRLGVDVIALVRGGGSMTDLAAFDDERVARAIAACATPVIAGVGHEIDESVADQMAYTRAPTPTAAAQLICGRVSRFEDATEAAWAAIEGAALSRLAAERTHLRSLRAETARAARGTLRLHRARLDGAARRLAPGRLRSVVSEQRRRINRSGRVMARLAQRRVHRGHTDLARAGARMAAAPRRHLDGRRHQLGHLTDKLRLLDPRSMLSRGWTITTDASGQVVRGPTQVRSGQTIVTTTATGTIDSTVTGLQPAPPDPAEEPR